MEDNSFNLDSESQPVVGVENFAVARDVIKSLRSSSNSNRHYQHNATRDNFLVDNLDDFNKIVAIKAAASAVAQSQEDRMNQSITNFKPPIRYIVPKHTNTNNGTFLYNATTGPAASSKSYDDFSSDDEPQPSPSKAKSPKYDDEDEYDLKADSSDDDDSWNSKPQKKHPSPPQHANHATRNATRKLKTDDDLDFGDDDDEADNAELFARFTAPVSNGNSSKNNKNGAPSTSSVSMDLSRSGKFNSTSTVASSVSGAAGKTGFASSSGKGSAGIRGIQELLKEPKDSSLRSSSNHHSSSNGNSTATSGGNSSLLSGIKPGQAIRVKAPGKRRNYASNGAVDGY